MATTSSASKTSSTGRSSNSGRANTSGTKLSGPSGISGISGGADSLGFMAPQGIKDLQSSISKEFGAQDSASGTSGGQEFGTHASTGKMSGRSFSDGAATSDSYGVSSGEGSSASKGGSNEFASQISRTNGGALDTHSATGFMTPQGVKGFQSSVSKEFGVQDSANGTSGRSFSDGAATSDSYGVSSGGGHTETLSGGQEFGTHASASEMSGRSFSIGAATSNSYDVSTGEGPSESLSRSGGVSHSVLESDRDAYSKEIAEQLAIHGLVAKHLEAAGMSDAILDDEALRFVAEAARQDPQSGSFRFQDENGQAVDVSTKEMLEAMDAAREQAVSEANFEASQDSEITSEPQAGAEMDMDF